MSKNELIDCKNIDNLNVKTAPEKELFQSIAICFGEEIRRYALVKCGRGRGDIEDITQDVLLAAQQYLQSFRGSSSLKTWLFHLVISACSHRRRGQKNDPHQHRPLEYMEHLATGTNPELELLINERLNTLQQALIELRPEDRSLLAAVEWEGLSLQEAATQNGLSVSAVKSRLFRIRQTIKAKLEP